MAADIINGITGEQLAAKRTTRDLEPGPGQVIVARQKETDVGETWGSGPIIKAERTKAEEAYYGRNATVLRLGEWDKTLTPWFEEGDEVVIQHTMFWPMELDAETTVWLGPQVAVKARWYDREVE